MYSELSPEEKDKLFTKDIVKAREDFLSIEALLNSKYNNTWLLAQFEEAVYLAYLKYYPVKP